MIVILSLAIFFLGYLTRIVGEEYRFELKNREKYIKKLEDNQRGEE